MSESLITCLSQPRIDTIEVYASDNIGWVLGAVSTLVMYFRSPGSEIYTTSLIPPSSSSPGASSLQDPRWLGMSGSSLWASVTNASPTLGHPARSRPKDVCQSLPIWNFSDTSKTASCGSQDEEVTKNM